MDPIRSWAGGAPDAGSPGKFLAAVVAPGLWRGRWRLPLVVAITIVALYAPVIGVGHGDLLGLLGGYGRDGLRDGSGIWLLA